MSAIPLVLRDWWEDFEKMRPSRLQDQDFGAGLRRDDLLSSINSFNGSNMFTNAYFRPWKIQNLTRTESASTINMNQEKFEVTLEIKQFSPNEITVKTVNNCIVIEGKHEEKHDEDGYVSRHFTRRYVLPQGHEVSDVISSISSDGVLTITSPKRKSSPSSNVERVVHIQQTEPSKPPTETQIKVETS